MLDASKMSQGNVRQERQLIRVAATPAACTVPPVHSPWTLTAVAGPCSPPSAPYSSSQYQVDRNAPGLRLLVGCIRTMSGRAAKRNGPSSGESWGRSLQLLKSANDHRAGLPLIDLLGRH